MMGESSLGCFRPSTFCLEFRFKNRCHRSATPQKVAMECRFSPRSMFRSRAYTSSAVVRHGIVRVLFLRLHVTRQPTNVHSVNGYGYVPVVLHRDAVTHSNDHLTGQ